MSICCDGSLAFEEVKGNADSGRSPYGGGYCDKLLVHDSRCARLPIRVADNFCHDIGHGWREDREAPKRGELPNQFEDVTTNDRMNIVRLQLFIAGIIGLMSIAEAQTPVTRDLKLKGGRFKPLTYDQLTPEQKAMVGDLVPGVRGGLGGPFNVLLRSPEMGELAQKLGAQLRLHSTLPGKLRELAIIITARYWNEQHEWHMHRQDALQEGISPATADAIAVGKRPRSLPPDEEIVYDFCTELLKKKM